VFWWGCPYRTSKGDDFVGLDLPVQVSDQLTNTLTHTQLEVEEGGENRAHKHSTADSVVKG
jgi:hypothetical protein